MNTSSKHTLAALGLLALLLGGCGQDTATGPQAVAPEVGFVEIRPTQVRITTELVGRTVSFLQAEVRPQVRGIIRARQFMEGGDVTQGQVLYQIEPETYQAAVDNARAALAKAEANQEVTRLRANRVSQLRKTNAISQQDNDDAQAAYLQGQAEVAAARAALDTALIDLNRTRVTAPISGRISKSSVTVGALVTTDQPSPLATIHQLDPMYVDVTQSAQDIMTLRRIMSANHYATGEQIPVRLLMTDGREYPHGGQLQFTDVGVNEATGTVTLRTEFPNPEHELLPGLYVRAVFTEGESNQALVVPQRSIVRDSRGNPQVLIAGPDNMAERRSITLGRSTDEGWIVTEGLNSGDRVIVEGIQRVRPGAPVNPVPYVPKAAEQNEQAGQAGADADTSEEATAVTTGS